jgi:prevent-host-death family protein
MKSVGIADLKQNLSRHLRGVRRGESLLVVDRTTPVARVVPIEDRGLALSLRRAIRAPGSLRSPRPVSRTLDSLAALLELRRNDR